MLTQLKQKIQTMLTAEARVAHSIGLTPNRISAIGVILAFFSAFSYAAWHIDSIYLLLAAFLLLLSGFCDALDGVVARIFHQSTVFGGFLDSLSDRYADAAVIAGIVIGGLCDTLWGLIALSGSLLVSYSRARAEAAGVKMESIGLAERAERIIILAAASIIAFLWEPKQVMNIAIILLAILSNLTVLQRSLYFQRKLKRQQTG